MGNKNEIPREIEDYFYLELGKIKQFSNGLHENISKNLKKYEKMFADKVSSEKSKTKEEIVQEILEEISKDFLTENQTMDKLKKEVIRLSSGSDLHEKFLVYYEEKLQEIHSMLIKDVLIGANPQHEEYFQNSFDKIYKRFLSENKCEICGITLSDARSEKCAKCGTNHAKMLDYSWSNTGSGWINLQCLHCNEKWTDYFD